MLGVAVGLAAGSLLRRANQQGLTQERLTDYYRRRAANYNATDQLQLFGRYPRIEMRQVTMRLADLQPGDKVLEIGTGSGYQAAVLAELGDGEVYSIEIVPELAAQAAERLQSLGYTDVQLTQGDGHQTQAPAAQSRRSAV